MSNTQGTTVEIPRELTPPLTSPNTTPRFSPKEITVVFVLGGPGSGKGTQSSRLVQEYGFVHLSAGDLLRAEQDRPGSQYGELIKNYIKEGKIVPMEITVKLLSNAMEEVINKKNRNKTNKGEGEGEGVKPRFLIDGFPRKLDQAVFFEDTVCPSEFTLFLSCPEEVMESRLLERGKTSGRADDNEESIRKRFRTFVETSMPVVEAFEKQGKVVEVDAASGGVEEVYERVKRGVEGRGVYPVSSSSSR